MELLGTGSGLASRIRDELRDEPLTLVDIGCSGGIDLAWRGFEPQLRAVGIDPNVEECARLSAIETNADVRYVGGFADWDHSSALAKAREQRGFVGNNPWNRLAVAATIEIRNSRSRSTRQLTSENQWQRVELSPRQIQLPGLFDEHGLADIDFIKIDVDGPDFLILDSIKAEFAKRRVLGLGMEVNFCGSADPSDHTFHNTDRFMRSLGFELFGITHRLYSMATLPQRYELSFPAQSVRGRPLQGDALYLRDLGDPAATHPFPLTRQKVLKLAALFDIFGKPDHAAEVLITYKDLIGNVDSLLDWLADHAEIKIPGGYKAYTAEFLKDSEAFYPPPPQAAPEAAAPASRSVIARLKRRLKRWLQRLGR
jgi:methyltransferase FkbM-like protein